jgi:molecular chaperone DnaJ
VLSDPEKRSSYDRYGRVDVRGLDGFADFGFGGLGEIFESFFGGFGGTPFGGTSQRNPQQGESLQAHSTLSFEEAVFGCQKEIEIQRIEICPSCNGIGCEPGTNPQTCPECRGTGQVRKVQQSVFGRFSHITTCSRCKGSGTIITHPCSQCHGKARIKAKRRLAVDIPAGVDDGYRMRLNGEGDAGIHGGLPGDLYVNLSVRPHRIFRRDGVDIFCKIPINFTQAALGDEMEVPSLDGKVTLRIPPYTQDGEVFRIKGKGVPQISRRGKGDLLVEVVVVTPNHLSKEQRQILEELAKTLPQAELP